MIEKVSKLGVWLPHTPSKENKEDRVSITTRLLKQRNNLFLKNSIAGYKNVSFMTMFNAKGS